MKIALLVILLLALGQTSPLSGAAQDVSGQRQVDQLLTDLEASDSNPDAKLRAAWELSLIGPPAKKALATLIKVLADSREHPKARMSALNAIGHINVSDQSAVGQITQVLRDHSKVFRGLGSKEIVNGSFEIISAENDEAKEKGAFGETMFPPGSLDLSGWMTYAGVLMIQDEGARPGGKNSLELGPRDVPGCVSQTIPTTIGANYELKFFACTGRGFAHFNRQLRVRVAGVDKTIDCVVGSASEMVKVPFQAASAFTTVTFLGVGGAGFGPMIDEVTVGPIDGAAPDALASESTRVRQLDAIVQRLRSRSKSSNQRGESQSRPRVVASEALPDGIALMSEEGEPYVGHQLEFFDKTEPGVLSTKKPAWISLYRTEGRDFVLAGEVSLGGAYEKMLFPGDLPDGFALFLREWGGLQRYQLDSQNITVKRRLFHGQPTPEIIVVAEFAPSRLGEWIPFQVRVSEGMIDYSFAGNVARLPGPLDTDGANKIAIAPGTRLRNLRLHVQSRLRPLDGAGVLPTDSGPEKGTVAVPPNGPGMPVEAGPAPRLGGRDGRRLFPNAPIEGGPKRVVPDGEYLVNLEWWNQKQTIRLKVIGAVAQVIKTSDPKLEGTTGTFQPLDDGGLYIFLKNDQEGFGGQIWRLQPDGSFEIKEIPDRGEKERAILAPQNL